MPHGVYCLAPWAGDMTDGVRALLGARVKANGLYLDPIEYQSSLQT